MTVMYQNIFSRNSENKRKYLSSRREKRSSLIANSRKVVSGKAFVRPSNLTMLLFGAVCLGACVFAGAGNILDGSEHERYTTRFGCQGITFDKTTEAYKINIDPQSDIEYTYSYAAIDFPAKDFSKDMSSQIHLSLFLTDEGIKALSPEGVEYAFAFELASRRSNFVSWYCSEDGFKPGWNELVLNLDAKGTADIKGSSVNGKSFDTLRKYAVWNRGRVAWNMLNQFGIKVFTKDDAPPFFVKLAGPVIGKPGYVQPEITEKAIPQMVEIPAVNETDKAEKRPAPPPFVVDRKFRHNPVVVFDNLKDWRLRCFDGAVGKLRLSNEQNLKNRPVAKLYAKGVTIGSRVEIVPPEPIKINKDIDNVTMWLHGNPRWHSGKLGLISRGSEAAVSVNFEDENGDKTNISLGRANFMGWYYLQNITPRTLQSGVKITGIEIRNINRVFGDMLYFDSLFVFKQSPESLVSKYSLPKDIPFPTTPDTILPTFKVRGENSTAETDGGYRFSYNGEDGEIVYSYTPRTGTLEDISVTCDGKTSFLPAAGSGVWFEFGGGAGQKTGRYGPGGLVGKLVNESLDNGVLKTTWKWTKDSESATLTYTFRIKQKSLVIELDSPEGKAASIYYGYAKNTPGAKVIDVMYMDSGPGVLCYKNYFVSLAADWYVSNASFWPAYPGKGKLGETQFEYAYLKNHRGISFEYNPKTDGKRNPLYERIFLTVSPDFQEVLPNIPNPQSTMGHITKNNLYLMQSSGPSVVGTDVREDYTKWLPARAKLLKSYGLDNIICMHHAAMFSRWGGSGYEGFTMTPNANPLQTGGLSAIVNYMDYLKTIGWIPGVYSGCWLMQPQSPAWDEDAIAQFSNGQWQSRSNYTSYRVKCTAAPALSAKWTRKLRETFHAQATYQDGTTANRPSAYIDYDARTEGAGKVSTVFKGFGMALLEARKALNGPVIGEGGGQMYYAGLTDGNYAMDIRFYQKKRYSPLLVDFDLLKIHPLEVGMAMHYVHYGNDLDRLLCASIAFGHMGYAGKGGWSDHRRGLDIPHVVRSYYMMQQIQKYYLLEKVEKIGYWNGSKLLDTSEAIITNAYENSQVFVEYATGLKVWANASFKDDWKVVHDRKEYLLPPTGWLVVLDDRIEEFSGLVDGHRIEYAYTPEYVYVNGNGKLFDFRGISTDGQVIVRKSQNELKATPVGKLKKLAVSPAEWGVDKRTFTVTRVTNTETKTATVRKHGSNYIDLDTLPLSGDYRVVSTFFIRGFDEGKQIDD